MTLPGPTFTALPATVVGTGSAAPYNLAGSPLMAFRDLSSSWSDFRFMDGVVIPKGVPPIDGSITTVNPTDRPAGAPPNLIGAYITPNHQLAAVTDMTTVLSAASPRVRGTPAVLTLTPLTSWRIYAIGVDSKPYRVDFSATTGFGTWSPVAAGGVYASDLTVASDGTTVSLFGIGYNGTLYQLNDSGPASHAMVMLGGQPVRATSAAAVVIGTDFHVLYVDPGNSQLRGIAQHAGAWQTSAIPASAPAHCRSVTMTAVDATQTWVAVVDSAATVWSAIATI